ncbi:MAG: DUF2304 family protein [Nitrospira sp.]|nr:DUF2304 family protein [Nitrospira sp.]
MLSIRIAGVIIGLLISFYIIYRYRSGRYQRLDMVIGLMVGVGVITLSISPAPATVLTDILGLRNRLFATLVMTNIGLVGLFLYVLNKANRANRQIGELVRALARQAYRESDLQGRRIEGKSIFVVIPAYNEAQALQGVLPRIPQVILNHQVQVIVVVDGSEDGTAEVARRESHLVVSHAMNRGQGDALRTGFEIALKERADIVVTMDADGQHKPEEIERLVQAVVEGTADFVIGSRFLGEYEDQGGSRHLGILIFTGLINLLGGIKISDCTNGFRVIRGSGLVRLRLREDKFSAPELIMEAARAGLRIKEVPVTILRRTEGKSKKPARLGYPLGFAWVIVKTWLR